MSHSASPTEGVTTPPAVEPSGSGWIVSHSCGWETYAARRPAADKAAREHSCRVKRERGTDKPRPKSDWNGREGATWIDSL